MLTLQNGMARLENNAYVGLTVSEVLEDVSLSESLGFSGDETVEVSTDGGSTFRVVDGSYVLSSGDFVRFSRSAGTKG